MALNFIDPSSKTAKVLAGNRALSIQSVVAAINAAAPRDSEVTGLIFDLDTGEREAFHLIKGKIKSFNSQDWTRMGDSIQITVNDFKEQDFAIPNRILLTVGKDNAWGRTLLDYSSLIQPEYNPEYFKESAKKFRNSVASGSWLASNFEHFELA